MPNLTPLELRVLRYLHDSPRNSWHTLSDVVEGLPGPYVAVRSALRTLTHRDLATRTAARGRALWACTALGEAEIRAGDQLRLVPDVA